MLAYLFTGSITKATALVLANAVYFKSGWVYKFKETLDESFYLTPSKEITVKMMHLKHDLLYYHDSNLKFAALELPYEVNISFKFISNILKSVKCIYFIFSTMLLK